MKNKHILIVDDDPNLLFSMEFILNTSNYKVTTARNGLEAIEKILKSINSEHPIELLITDFRMQGIDGLELIAKLNRLKVELPKLVITAFGNKQLKSDLKRLGCVELLEKPFNKEDLVSRVTRLLNNGGNELTNLERRAK